MGKTKAAAPKKESKKSAPAVKEGRVTKVTDTPKSKSKAIAKAAATKVDEKKKSKKAKKEPTPESESEESSSSEAESESESESESSSEEEKPVAKKAAAKAESSDSSDSESDSESESEDEKPAAKAAAKKAESSSDSESDSSESESEEEKKPAAKKAEASSDSSDSESGSDSDDSSDSEESSEEASSEEAPSKKRKAEDEAPAAVKKNKTEEPAEEGIKNLFVGNLSWSVDEEWLQREFEQFGEITGIRIITDRESGRPKGFGYVEFASAADAKKAKEAMHDYELDGRKMNIDFSTPRPAQQNREGAGDRANRYGDKRSAPSNTLFIGNISFNATNDVISETFSEYGSITRVSLPTDRETGNPKGFGYVDFETTEQATAALEALNGADIEGRPIRIDYAAARDNAGGSGGFGGGRGGGRGGARGGRGGFGDRGGRGGGRGRGGPRGGGRGGFTTNRGGFGDFKGQKVTF